MWKEMWVLVVLTMLLMAGCAGSTGARTDELLSQDYTAMSDQELLTYYYRLNDQIARVERQARGSAVGVGIGTGPVRIGASQGVSRGTIAEDLRERRNLVRSELTIRGLRP